MTDNVVAEMDEHLSREDRVLARLRRRAEDYASQPARDSFFDVSGHSQWGVRRRGDARSRQRFCKVVSVNACGASVSSGARTSVRALRNR